MITPSPEPTDRKLDTAVIPLAGIGTRMWPYTAGSPKFMAPIYIGLEATPNIDFTLNDCIKAGIRNIIFITSSGGDEVLRKYLGPLDKDTIDRYKSVGKIEALHNEQARRDIFARMNISYINQPAGPYGTAIPLSLAKPMLQGVPYFTVTGGDDFLWNIDGTSEIGKQITGWRNSGAANSIMGLSVARTEAPNYAWLKQDDSARLTGIVEKPALHILPEKPLVTISRYILTDDIWPLLASYLATSRIPEQPEYYITDVIGNAIASGQTFHTHIVEGRYFDAGSPAGALHASLTLTEEYKTP